MIRKLLTRLLLRILKVEFFVISTSEVVSDSEAAHWLGAPLAQDAITRRLYAGLVAQAADMGLAEVSHSHVPISLSTRFDATLFVIGRKHRPT